MIQFLAMFLFASFYRLIWIQLKLVISIDSSYFTIFIWGNPKQRYRVFLQLIFLYIRLLITDVNNWINTVFLLQNKPNFFYQVARDAVLKFRPHINITSYHSDVKDVEFDIDFFKKFNVVLNGLDNLDARRHVNRLCLAAEVPLVESGTTGFLGQVWIFYFYRKLNNWLYLDSRTDFFYMNL